MENNYENISTPESKTALLQLAEAERYDTSQDRFPYVVTFKGRSYDLRDVDGGKATYRMTSESRLHLPQPNYIKVDKRGFVVKEWDR